MNSVLQFLLRLLVALALLLNTSVVAHGSRKNEKCYPGYGCFRPLSFLGFHYYPSSSSKNDVVFKLFARTTDQFEGPQEFTHSLTPPETFPGFMPDKETKIIVHGLHGLCEESWILELIRELLKKGDFNVICVDWREGARHINYVKSAANTQMVGKIISLFIRSLEIVFGKNIRQQIHLIGFSLGAHAAGFVGFQTPGLKRITGLDPAGPLFVRLETSQRLDPSDALFVDVIHTNGQALVFGGAGTMKRMGTMDFYANGGKKQPGCTNAISSILHNLLNYIGKGKWMNFRCNHERSIEIFTESINSPCMIRAENCSSWMKYTSGDCHISHKLGNPVGFAADKGPIIAGTYYFSTRSISPFCGPQYFANISIGSISSCSETKQQSGQLTLTFKYGGKELQALDLDANDIQVPGIITQILTLDTLDSFDSVYIAYESRGFNWWNLFGVNALRVLSLSLTDLRNGSEFKWTLDSESSVLSSGTTLKLKEIT